MKKNLFFRLFLLIAFSISLYSCVHDDVSSSTDPASKGYTNKSLWEEDEKYIGNVMKIFEEHADKEYFANNFGVVSWDHALTMGNFDESFLEAPVVKNGKINFILLAIREGDRVYFKRKDEQSSKDFFNTLVFTDRERNRLTGRVVQNSGTASKTGICYTVETTVTWTNDDGSAGPTYSYSETHCVSTGPSLPCQAIEEGADCGGPSTGGSGGSGGGGYGYPPAGNEGPNFITECAQLKTQNTNPNYKSKIEALDKPSILSKKQETGYSEDKNGNFTDLSVSQNTGNDHDGLTIPVSANTKGYIHSHLNNYLTGNLNENGEQEEKQPIRIFSPADVNILMTIAGFVTNGNYEDLYGTMVSSSGTYTIKFTGTAVDIKTGFDTDAWRDKYRIYKVKHDEWTLEKLFLTFMRDEMGVSGISLYKIKGNGNAQKKTLNSNNKIETANCPT